MTAALPGVSIVSTGGTIANTLGGRVGVDEVLAAIETRYPDSGLARYAELSSVEVLREGAASLRPADWLTIAQAVNAALAASHTAGVVVTHGTFSAEETAYFLHLTVQSDKPVVVACSQRKHNTIGNDGDKNLLDAVRVAASPAARGLGVVVLLNEEIHSAREVTKTNQRPSGFRSGSLGLLGSVEADRVTLYRRPVRRHSLGSEFGPPLPDVLPRVDVVATYAGADDVAVRAFVDAGAQGLVVNGFSYSGRPHPDQEPGLFAALERGIPVVLVNRGGDGRIPIETRDGFVRGDNLTAQKARVLLSLALTRTTAADELQRIFNEY